MAFLSILGLYHYDPSVFDGLVIPTADDIRTTAPVVKNPFVPDKETLVNYICMELAELSLVYASPATVKEMIGVWSQVHLNEWIELYNTLILEYNPIWNKDGTRTHHVVGDLHLMTGGATTKTQTDITSETKSNVTGYDTNAYSPNTQDIVHNTGDLDSNQNKFVYDNQKDHADYTETDVEQGNIGVSTTMSMIAEQREIVKFNLYEYITQQFKNQFCVMVY